MNLQKIKFIQQLLWAENFNVYITNDEDKGLHISDDNFNDIDEENPLHGISDLNVFVFESGRKIVVEFQIKKMLESGLIKLSSKRETIFIDYEVLYDDKDATVIDSEYNRNRRLHYANVLYGRDNHDD
jgi:hypothetical protein